MRGLVDGWLQGIGLGYAVPIFSAQSINTPESLSRLEVVDFPELGISDQNDRKKVKKSYREGCYTASPVSRYVCCRTLICRCSGEPIVDVLREE